MSNLHQHPSEYLDHISSQAFFLRGRILATLVVAVLHLMMSVRSKRQSIWIGTSKRSLAWQMQRRRAKAGVGMSTSESGSPAKNIWMALGQKRIAGTVLAFCRIRLRARTRWQNLYVHQTIRI